MLVGPVNIRGCVLKAGLRKCLDDFVLVLFLDCIEISGYDTIVNVLVNGIKYPLDLLAALAGFHKDPHV